MPATRANRRLPVTRPPPHRADRAREDPLCHYTDIAKQSAVPVWVTTARAKTDSTSWRLGGRRVRMASTKQRRTRRPRRETEPEEREPDAVMDDDEADEDGQDDEPDR